LRSLSQRSYRGTQKAIILYLCCTSPLKFSRDSSTLVSKQSPTHCSHRSSAPTGAVWLPTQEVGRRSGHLLTQDIEDSFSDKKKAGAVFVDLTAAYGTVWHRGLTCKLLRLLPYRHMVHTIMEMVSNRSFTLTTGQRSWLRRLKNGVPQGSVLAPFCSTSTPLTCQPPSPESMHMLHQRPSNHAC